MDPIHVCADRRLQKKNTIQLLSDSVFLFFRSFVASFIRPFLMKVREGILHISVARSLADAHVHIFSSRRNTHRKQDGFTVSVIYDVHPLMCVCMYQATINIVSIVGRGQRTSYT